MNEDRPSSPRAVPDTGDGSEERRGHGFTRFVVDHMSEPAMWTNARGRFVYVNEAACRALQYTRDELLSMSVPDVDVNLHPEEWPAHWEELRRRGSFMMESRQRAKDGREFPVEVVVNHVRFEGREFNCAVVRDISERERAEQEVRLLTTALDAAANGVVLTDRKGVVQWSNPAFTRLTGYAPEEVLGRSTNMFKSGEHDEAFYRELWTTILGGLVWRGELINRKKDGALYVEEMTITPVHCRRGEITHFIAIKQDVTDRKIAEDALRQAEAGHRALLDNAGYGIYRSTIEGKFLYVNPALATMLGYESPEALMAVDMTHALYRDEEERARLVARYRGSDRIEGLEVEWKRKDGKPLTVRLRERVMRGPSSEPEGYEAIAEDVTERRLLEAQLAQAQKMEAVGRLAGGVAHDFNNLLTAINGYSSILETKLETDTALQHYARAIRETGERAASLTRQLLAFSRKEASPVSETDLNAAIEDTAELLTRLIGEDIGLHLSLDPTLDPVEVDTMQISQIIMNLAINARDAMPRGGKLRIATKNAALDEGYARDHRGADPGFYAMVSVSDTGCGMDRATQERIFEPFFTTKEPTKGTGLGLATVYGIVKKARGNIWVYSEPGRGTIFKVYLPHAEAGATAAEAAVPRTAERQSMPGGSETILVAEDEESVRELVVETLTGHGYKVLEAAHGIDAILQCERFEGLIDLLITDVIMPHMSGGELVRRVMKSRPGTRAIFVSGYSADAISNHAKLGPTASLLEKPFTLSSLLQKVRQVLEAPTVSPHAS